MGFENRPRPVGLQEVGVGRQQHPGVSIDVGWVGAELSELDIREPLTDRRHDAQFVRCQSRGLLKDKADLGTRFGQFDRAFETVCSRRIDQ